MVGMSSSVGGKEVAVDGTGCESALCVEQMLTDTGAEILRHCGPMRTSRRRPTDGGSRSDGSESVSSSHEGANEVDGRAVVGQRTSPMRCS